MAVTWDSRGEAQTFISPMEAETSQQPREIGSDKRGSGPRRLLRGVRSRGTRAWGEDGPASGPRPSVSISQRCGALERGAVRVGPAVSAPEQARVRAGWLATRPTWPVT
jgi:hypothetical protein